MTISTTPAPARTDRPAGGTAVPPGDGVPAEGRRGGSRPLAAALVAGPVLVAASVLLHPDDTHGVEHTLEGIGGSAKVMWNVIHVLEPAGWLLIGFTLLLALPRMAGDRGRVALKVAGVLAALGFPSLALVVYAHGEAFRFMAATDVAHSTYAPLFELLETGVPLAAGFVMLAKLSLVVGAVGLVRARTVPVWAAGLLAVAGVVLGAAAMLPLPLGIAVGFGTMVVTFAYCARRIAATGGPALGGSR